MNKPFVMIEAGAGDFCAEVCTDKFTYSSMPPIKRGDHAEIRLQFGEVLRAILLLSPHAGHLVLVECLPNQWPDRKILRCWNFESSIGKIIPTYVVGQRVELAGKHMVIEHVWPSGTYMCRPLNRWERMWLWLEQWAERG